MTALIAILAFRPVIDNDCNCDKVATEKIIKSKDFNKLPQFYDTLTDDGFYSLSAADNRTLWYRDIESPEETKFTNLWNDYAPNNYHAAHLDYIKNYEGKDDIELAFQFGPNSDLWAYHTFVIKKTDCCYLATRTYFRHARFTRKSYAIMDKSQLDSLFSVINEQPVLPPDTTETFDYCGYFCDNRNKKKFYINFEESSILTPVPNQPDTTFKQQVPRPEINRLYDFVDRKIKWIQTYSL
ncbi:MAG: hypothetical protein MUC87_00725 [Bacteroidia bacterium]|nr:hypothetical protein [Bacteroidia bacterium]